MKKTFLFTTFLITTLLLLPAQFNAQDILYIEPTPPGNINEIINGDTVAGGLRANPDRIYQLGRQFIYQYTEEIKVNGNLKIIATDPVGDINAIENRPPVIAPAILPDNSSPGGHFFNFIGEGAEVELSDLYLLSVRADGDLLGWSNALRIGADNISVKLRGIIFDAFTGQGINNEGHFHKLDVQDCVFRNFQNANSYFYGEPMRHNPGFIHSDTVKFINNTYFANNGYAWDIRGYDKHSVFEHNTVVYQLVNTFLMRQNSNVHMNNNLFYAAHAYGGIPTHRYNGWFLNTDTTASSIFRTRGQDSVSSMALLTGTTLSGPEGFVDPDKGITLDLFDPTMRVINAQNNAYHFPQALFDFYDAYNDTVQTYDSLDVPVIGGESIRKPVLRTLTKPRWINDYVQWTLDSLYPAIGVQATVENNNDMDPGFNTDITDHVGELTNYINKIGTGALDGTAWLYNPNESLYPPAWPIPENLAYSNAAMQSMGTDGFALGDLNWFPDQKEEWLNYTPPEPLIMVDGEKDSFYDGLTGPADGYLQIQFFANNDNGAPDNNDDHSAHLWAAWDETWFYLYEEVTDDVVNGEAVNPWETDCIELKIDGMPDTEGQNISFDTRLSALATGNSDDMNNIAAADKQFFRKTTDDGYVLELAIKLSALGGSEAIAAEVGGKFGLGIGLHDNDDGSRNSSLQWSAVMLDAIWNTADYLGTIEFLADNKVNFIPTNNMTGVTNEIPYDGSVVGIEDLSNIPTTYAMNQNYPNPFNPSTSIQYQLPKTSNVKIKIYNMLGQLVKTLVNEEVKAGYHNVSFDASSLSSGTYFYSIKAGDFVQTKKMMLLK